MKAVEVQMDLLRAAALGEFALILSGQPSRRFDLAHIRPLGSLEDAPRQVHSLHPHLSAPAIARFPQNTHQLASLNRANAMAQ